MADSTAGLSAVPDEELAWCHDVVGDVSRTFALTVDALEEPMSSYICVGYLLCRIADTIEDSRAIPASEKTALLERYDRVLDSADDYDADAFEEAVGPSVPAERPDDWVVVASSSRVVGTFDRLPADVKAAVTPPTRELVQGMALFVDRYADRGGIRIQSLEELESYCYYVAGTVGHLVTNLLVREVGDEAVAARLRERAEEFGLLLQLVNVAKDVHADYTQENSVYLPADWLERAGASQDDLLSPDQSAGVASVVERTADHARSYLDDAHSYLDALSGIDQNAYAAWTIPFLLAVGTLRELSHRPEDALTPGGVKVSRREVSAVVTAATTDSDDRSLTTLRKAVRRGDLP
jgi:farnesyl-diphosphate farnesyltransferase